MVPFWFNVDSTPSVKAALPSSPDQPVSSHSFRIRAATTAASAKVSSWLIQQLGRWNSNCHQIYIRVPDQTIDNTCSLLSTTLTTNGVWNPDLMLQWNVTSIWRSDFIYICSWYISHTCNHWCLYCACRSLLLVSHPGILWWALFVVLGVTTWAFLWRSSSATGTFGTFLLASMWLVVYHAAWILGYTEPLVNYPMPHFG